MTSAPTPAAVDATGKRQVDKRRVDKRLVHTVFERQASLFPQRTAVEEEGPLGTRSQTYGGLEQDANRLARRLLACGLGPGDVVAVTVRPGISQIASLLAVLKAGLVYMPLDLSFPTERCQRMLAIGKPRAVITEHSGREILARSVPESIDPLETVIWSDDGELEDVDLAAAAPPNVTVDPEAGCYLFFTSGSTGEPKAILGKHKSLGHFVHWQATELGLDSSVRVSQLVPLTFDASLRDILTPLSVAGTVCVPTAEERGHMGRLVDRLRQSRVTLVHTVPSVFRRLTAQLLEQGSGNPLPDLKYVLLAGEALYPRDVRAWRDALGPGAAEVINLYGATENTLIKMFYRVPANILANPLDLEDPASKDPASKDPERPLPIGRPIANTVAFICRDGRLATPGEVGEIYIKTPFLSHGYYGDAAATSRIFVPNPLANGEAAAADLVHRTGDLGRYLDNQTLEWAGRADDLLKVNGARVEPEEVKAVTLRHPRIRDAAIVGLPDGFGGHRLVCYYVVEAKPEKTTGSESSTGSEPLSSDQLADWQRQNLPAYMVPSFRIPLPSLPLNRHGKLDRQALPSPEQALEQNPVTAPRDSVEQTVHNIWCQVLNLPRVDIHRSFFDLGGHSLAAARILPRLYQSLGVEATPAQLFNNPTVAGQSRQIRSLMDQSADPSSLSTSALESLEPAPAAESYPLSHAQRRLWVLRQLDEAGSAYNMPGCYLLRGELQPEAVRQALQLLLDRHEILRTAVVEVNGEPRQRPMDPCSLDWRVEDLSRRSDAEQEAQKLARAEADRPFDLTTAPLMRATLLRLAERQGRPQHVLLLTLHHIACDGWSLGLLLREWRRAYSAIIHRRLDSLPRPAALQYKDYAHWQHRRLAASALNAHRDYWHQRLKGPLPVLDLASDRPRSQTQTFAGHTLSRTWDAQLSSAFHAFCSARQTSLFTGLLAVLQILLHRLTHQQDLIVGTAVATRPHPDLEEQIGCYLNLLALRGQVNPSAGFAEHCRQAATTTTEALAHQHYPFDSLVDELQVPRDLSRSPVFDVMLMVHNQHTLENLDQVDPQADLQITDFMPRDGVSRYDLTVHCRQVRGQEVRGQEVCGQEVQGSGDETRLQVELEYNSDLYSRRRMEDMLTTFERLARAALAEPHRAVAHLPLTSQTQLAELTRWAEAPALEADTADVSELFHRQCQDHAAKPAVICANRRMSYQELAALTTKVADMLRAQEPAGSRPSTPVAVMLERDERLPAVFLGALASGVAYVPIDPSFPQARVLHMLRHSGCRLLITEPSIAADLCSKPGLLPDGLRLITLDEPAGHGPVLQAEIRGFEAEAPAYIIYTSGSTGEPKGVTVKRSNAAAYTEALRRLLKPRPDDRILALTTVSFDIAFTELVVAPALGISVVMADSEDVLDPNRLARLIQHQGVTLVQTTPSRLELILEQAGDAFLAGLRTLLIGGEPFPERLRERLAGFPHLRVINVYGPTESTVWSAFCPLNGDGAEGGPIHLGRAAVGESLRVLSPASEPMPVGYAGELCVGGAGVAAGYHRRPALTAERFIPDPWNPEGRLYRTGDLAMWTPEGRLLFLGRRDFQVKFRGYRIEPGEIENHLCRHPDLARAVVSVIQVDGEPALCAHCVPVHGHDPSTAGDLAKGSQPNIEDLRRRLAESLPAYMIPSHFVFLPELPTTANNKVDRKALPKPTPGPQPAGNGRSMAPRTPTEQRIARFWSHVLGLPTVNVEQRFFDSGGDSVRAIRLLRLLNEAWPGAFKASDLFTAVTIAEQAGLVAAFERPTDGGDRDTQRGSQPSPASPDHDIVEIEI